MFLASFVVLGPTVVSDSNGTTVFAIFDAIFDPFVRSGPSYGGCRRKDEYV